MKKVFVAAFVLAFVVACGDDTDNSNDANSGDQEVCRFVAELSGAVDESLSLNVDDGCAYSDSEGELGLLWGFQLGPEVLVTIEGVNPEEVSSGLNASLRFQNIDIDQWTSQDCTVNLTRNELVETELIETDEDTYALEGTGSCTSNLIPSGGDASGEVTISGFEFGAISPLP